MGLGHDNFQHIIRWQFTNEMDLSGFVSYPFPMAKLRIISTPPGQAPEYIRRAWLGLELPLAVSKPKAVHSAGVVSGRGSLGVWLGLLTGAVKENSGWVVPAEGALAVLEVSRPDAAQWWRVNLPHLFTPGRKLVFATACGEAVAEPGDPPVPANSSDPNPTPLVLLLLIEIGCALGITASSRSGQTVFRVDDGLAEYDLDTPVVASGLSDGDLGQGPAADHRACAQVEWDEPRGSTEHALRSGPPMCLFRTTETCQATVFRIHGLP